MNFLIRAILIRLLVLIVIVLGVILALRTDVKAEVYSTGMIGVFGSGKSSLSETKLLNLGLRQDLGQIFTQQYEGGFWLDRSGHDRKSSGYLAYLAGVSANGPILARFMVGPSLISTPDIYLGGYFQFTEEFSLGVKGSNGNSVGMKYKHFSSAGLETPNNGRDFLGIELGIDF